MEVILAGPGRAGLAVALALTGAGHRVTGVLARRLEGLEAASAVLPGRALARVARAVAPRRSC